MSGKSERKNGGFEDPRPSGIVSEHLGARCVSRLGEFDHVFIDQDAIERLARELSCQRLDAPRWEHPAFPAEAGDDLDATVWLGNALNFCYWVPRGESMWGIEIAGKREVDAFALFGLLHGAIGEGFDLLDGGVLRSVVPKMLFARGDGFLPLVDQRVRILEEIGKVLQISFEGRLQNAVEAAGNDALAHANFLAARFPSFRDVCEYKGHAIPLCKRAQLAAGMLHGARLARGGGGLSGTEKLTVYADYMLPVTLRHFGVFRFSDHLAAIIADRCVMQADCPEVSEIRIGTVAAGEMIVRAARDMGMEIDGLKLDFWLWRKGFEVETDYPHHRVVTTDY